MTTINRLYAIKSYGAYVVLGVAVLLAYLAANRYEAPEFDIVDSCEDTFTFDYVTNEGEIGRTDGRLAWLKGDDGDVLCLYDQDKEIGVKASDSIVEQYKDRIEEREYGWYRYFFWIPFILFAVVFAFVLVVVWGCLSDYLISRVVISRDNRDECLVFLQQKSSCGRKAVERVFAKHTRALIESKKKQWRPAFKPEFYQVLENMLGEVAASHNVMMRYSLKYGIEDFDMGAYLRKVKDAGLKAPPSDNWLKVLGRVAELEKYTFEKAEVKVPEIKFREFADNFMDRLFEKWLHERFFTLEAVDRKELSDRKPGRLYVDVTILPSLDPISIHKSNSTTGLCVDIVHYPGFSIEVKVYTYRNTAESGVTTRLEQYVIYFNTFNANFKYNSDENSFSAKDLYKEGVKQTMDRIISSLN